MAAGFGTNAVSIMRGSLAEHDGSIASIAEVGTAYKFKSNAFVVPLNLLNQKEAVKNIDLTYYQTKCREVLKKVYD